MSSNGQSIAAQPTSVLPELSNQHRPQKSDLNEKMLIGQRSTIWNFQAEQKGAGNW